MLNEYTIDDLKDVLDRGAEIDFEYGGQKFSISQTKQGIHLTKHKEWENTQTYNSPTELIEKAIIDGNSFKDIWSSVIVTMWL